MFVLQRYLTFDGKDIFTEWHVQLRDAKARVAIDRRILRLELGNFGDHKFCRDGVWELRIDLGAGYRVYYALSELRLIVILCGGDKHSHVADIERACRYWQDWQRRTK